MADFEIRASGNVAVPPGRVWAQILDRTGVPGWLEGVVEVGGEGEVVLIRREGEPGWLLGQVSDFEPRRRLGLRFPSPTSLLREVRVEVSLDDADGGTDYEVRITAQPKLLGALLLPVLRFRSEVALVRAVGGFRAALDDGREADRRRFRRPSRPAPATSDEAMRLAALG